MTKRHHHRRHGSGFSLLEVLVAFVVLSLVATALFRLFSGALRNALAADEYSRAVLVAESVLEEAAAGTLRESTRSGTADEGRVQWAVRIGPYDATDVNPELEQLSSTLPTRMYRVASEVTFASPNGGQRTITLSTIRVGAREAQ
ncbi:MAG: prepilin-type N-terminal cleavage/methylation domain-containing protein [Betaproteobacteria bacterium]